MSNIDAEKYKETISALGSVFGTKGQIIGLEGLPKGPEIKAIETLRDRLEDVIKNNGYDDFVKLIKNERGVTVRILEDIIFASGRAELSEESKQVLHKISEILKDLPNDIRIEGHTDNVPIGTSQFPSNWHLSVARATNTAYYLMYSEDIAPDRVSIVGYSEFQPVSPNDTPEGRALNRRVDLIILKQPAEDDETKDTSIR